MSIYEYDEERHMRQEREESRAEGFGMGAEYTLKLTLLLLKAGRTEDIKRAAKDEKFRQSLYEEFHIL